MKKITFVVLTLVTSACVKSKFSGDTPTGKSTNVNDGNVQGTPGTTPSTGTPGSQIPGTGSTPLTDENKPGQNQDPVQNGTTPSTDGTIDPLDPKLKCSADGAAAKMVELVQPIKFAARPAGSGCRWNVAPNVGPRDGHIQAAETSSQTLKLPAGEICEMAIDSPKDATLVYDDMLVLAVDQKAIFISSADLLRFLNKDNGLYTWDFNRLVTKAADFENKGVFYCLNSNVAECFIPRTETTGGVAINLPNSAIGPLSDYMRGKTQVALNLTVTGDDDDGVTKDNKGVTKPNIDCRHSELNLNVKIKYLP